MLDNAENYYQLFGLPVGFIVDSDQLASRYRELSKVVHPDRFANASDQERRISLEQTTRINEAFQTLKDPVRRAQYLLTLNGIEMQAEQETTRDTSFLMEQLELREALEQAPNAEDPFQEVDQLMIKITGMIKRLIAKMAIQFEDATPEQLEQARESIRKMQFLSKLHSEAEAVEARLEEAD
ncbi:MAG: co-chaperone HscB [bacterium]